MQMFTRSRFLSLAPLFATFASCYQGTEEAGLQTGVSGAEESEDAPQVRDPMGTSLVLLVTDPHGKPIPEARVSLPLAAQSGPPEGATPALVPGNPAHLMQPVAKYLDRIEYQTNAGGRVLMEELERFVGDRLVAQVEASGYAPASVVLNGVSQDAHMSATAVLHPVAAKKAFDTRMGVTFEHAGLRVEIPADGVVDEFGGIVEGVVEMSVVPFDSTRQVLTMPAPLEATRTDGTTTSLRSLQMAEITITREGMPLQLAPGTRARLELPLPASLRAGAHPPKIGDVIPAWHLDLKTGKWIEEGKGEVVAATGRPGELAWQTEVEHFTWWNVDEPWTEHSCFMVTVHDNGTPKQGYVVQLVGDWGVSEPQVTDANGQACTAMARGEPGTLLVGAPNDPLVPAVNVQGVQDAAACDGNGNACEGLPVDISGVDIECTDGQSYKCQYTGPAGTEGIGKCEAGEVLCQNNTWQPCSPSVLPDPVENPNTPVDDNCNGLTDDGDAECPLLNDIAACYDGPPGTLNVGECVAGEKKCVFDPNQNMLVWGGCLGAVPPELVEDCMTEIDENCDGNWGCGETMWKQTLGAGGEVASQRFIAVAVGSNGDVFALGRAAGAFQFAGKNLNLGQTEEVVLARMSADGTALDINSLGTGLTNELEMVVRGDQQVFVSGTLDGLGDQPGAFNALGCQANGSDAVDGLLLEFDGVATCVRSRVLGGAGGPAIPSGLAIAGDKVLVTGAFGGTLGPLATVPNQDDAFVVGLDANDITQPMLLAQRIATGWPSIYVNRPAIAATPGGFALVFAYVGIVTLAGDNFAAAGVNGSTLIALFDTNGTAQWAANVGDHAVPAGAGYAITLDGAGSITVAADHGAGLRVSQWQDPDGAKWQADLNGIMLGDPTQGGARLAADGDRVVLNAVIVQDIRHGYMHKWTANGTTDWEHSTTDIGAVEPFGVAVSPKNRSTVVVGQFRGDVTFPGGAMLSLGAVGDESDAYVVNLQQ